jgi:hypothetical protein
MELDSYQQVDGGSDGQKWWKTSNKNGEMNHKSGTWMLVLRAEKAKGFIREWLKHSCQISRQM